MGALLKRTRLIGLVVVLSGCGGADWSGRYQGNLVHELDCGDGPERWTDEGLWTIEPVGGREGRWLVKFSEDTVCETGTLNESEAGGSVLLEPASCDGVKDDRYDKRYRAQGGTLKLAKDSVDVDVRFEGTLTVTPLGISEGRRSLMCVERITGTMLRLSN